ncbi:hypothetical protein PBY51_006302 [Eleginops maclovinus]|uniref:Uncharacterized protein n=1 Tax=Eleginops maclovinus TaxID=56733 RepID=A0AAN7WWU8_ELEMC|nr:hypothetical protein PBY51_006302 [Eleginops maclovinus]
MAHAAAHIKKARSEMDQPPDLKALEKARERRRRSRERAERKRKVQGRLPRITHLFIPPSHSQSSIDPHQTVTAPSHNEEVFIRVQYQEAGTMITTVLILQVLIEME